MSTTTNIIYTDTEGKGTITLYENHFDKGGKYYARFDRQTATVDNLIARMQKKDIGINAINTKHILSLFKAEIIESLKRGESVNLMDLGSFYLSASGTKGNTVETAEIEKVLVKFSPSKEMKKAVSSIEVSKIALADSSPAIESVTDIYTEKTDGTLTAQKPVRLTGKKLKISGEESGIFFAECSEDGSCSEDESTWIKAGHIIRNFHSTLEFFLPESLESGKNYRIVLRTNCRVDEITKKPVSFTSSVSDMVTIA